MKWHAKGTFTYTVTVDVDDEVEALDRDEVWRRIRDKYEPAMGEARWDDDDLDIWSHEDDNLKLGYDGKSALDAWNAGLPIKPRR